MNTYLRRGLGRRLMLTLFAVGAFLTARGEYDPAYYAGMDGKRREALKEAVKQAVKQHRTLIYSDLPNYWQYTDVYPELTDGCKRWWEMYSNGIYLIRAGQSAKASFSANGMNREHSVPKSWWKVGNDVEYTPAYSDLWNLYPSDSEANMAKSNYPLGIVATATFDNNATKVGIPVYGYGGGASSVFEPADEYKGDFARSFFYMACVYDDISWQSRYNWMFVRASYPTLQPWAYEMLLQWARQDQVSQKEILRNNAVEQSQGNRNPFIDFPELAEYIWGTRTAEVFRISEQGGQVTPPITGEPELTLPVNDEWLDFGEVAVDGSGTAWLKLQGRNFTAPLSLRVGGTDKDMYTLSTRSIPASAINTTGEYLLPIMYTPTGEGEHTATLSIYDGGLASSVRVNLKGRGLPRPTLTALNAMAPIDVKETAYTAVWSEAREAVDYYVLYRTRYYADGAETDTYESQTNTLRLTDRDPDVAESYAVSSSRLGYLSPISNSVMVEASGVEGIEVEEALMLAPMAGGLRVLTSLGAVALTVYDADGRVVTERSGLAHGDEILLPKGVYVVKSDVLRMPKKIII